MNGLFTRLVDEEFFVDFITKRYQEVPGEICSVMWCVPDIDVDRVKYAHGEYSQSIEKFGLYLHSENPDHYKRSGALLHALYGAKCVKNHGLQFEAEEVESGFSKVTHDDGQHVLPFLKFYENYHNQLLAFNVAFRCCQSYEPNPPNLTFDYLRNICHYMLKNDNLSVDSFFMLFKSLMHER